MNQERTASMLLEAMRDVWCERSDTKELEFNCKRCEFSQGENCLVKRFINNRQKEKEAAELDALCKMLATEPCKKSEVAE